MLITIATIATTIVATVVAIGAYLWAYDRLAWYERDGAAYFADSLWLAVMTATLAFGLAPEFFLAIIAINVLVTLRAAELLR